MCYIARKAQWFSLGYLAGAFYGMEGIPKRWVEKIAMRDLMVDYADRLFGMRSLDDVELQVSYGSSEKIDQYLDIIEDFMCRVVDLEPGNYGFSDESKVWHLGMDMAEVVRRVRQVYGVEIDDDSDTLLVEVFEKIRAGKMG